MLTFTLPPQIQDLIDADTHEVARLGLISIVKHKATHEIFLVIARALVDGKPLQPVLSPVIDSLEKLLESYRDSQTKPVPSIAAGNNIMQAATGNIIQAATDNIIQATVASVGVLQATTALIGVGTVAGVVLSAVNLHQTLKLREDVKQLRVEVQDGFIDLKKVLRNQGTELIQRIDEVAQDIKFEQHRIVLIQAYGRFLEATKLMKIAMSCEDVSIRNGDLANARQMLAEALADYNNPRLLSETSGAGQLRRLECAWAIEQTIALSYQLQNEPAAVSDRLSHLQDKIRQDSLTVIDRCETEDELDFLFPELTRIHDHDLAVLESWQNHVDWMRSLPPSELKLLQSADFSNSEIAEPDTNATTISLEVPPEQLLYENLKQKSHPASLRDQLVLMMKPSLRQEFASYISQQAAIAGYKTLVPANLQKASDLAVANLYWYFKVRDESEEEAVTA